MTTSVPEHRFQCPSPESTLALGHAIGHASEPGLVVALVGILGAGKTLLARGVAEGLDVADPHTVSSPTFVLLQEYAGRLPIYHFDTYRLAGPESFAALGPEEYFEGEGVTLVEWADRVESLLPADRLDVVIEMDSPATRRVTIRARGPQAARVLDRIVSLAGNAT